MFTGIVEEMGHIASIRQGKGGIRLEIEAARILEGVGTGDSIAVSGCCLTVESHSSTAFVAYASPETMAKTALGDLSPGSAVNLERALTLQTRLGGHLVSGHIDGTGQFRSATRNDESWEVRIAAPSALLAQCIPKGSIAIDGISLTIVDLTASEFSLWIIPETWERTTLGQRKPGDRVNLETDLIGKYVFRFLETSGNSTNGTAAMDARLADLLRGWGGG